jgi:hypothetical protein
MSLCVSPIMFMREPSKSVIIFRSLVSFITACTGRNLLVQLEGRRFSTEANGQTFSSKRHEIALVFILYRNSRYFCSLAVSFFPSIFVYVPESVVDTACKTSCLNLSSKAYLSRLTKL